MTRRDYQDAAGAAIRAALVIDRKNRILVKMPTGTGKTVLFAGLFEILDEWLQRQPGKRMLVVAHREELLDQAAEKIQRANPDKIITIEQGSRRASVYSDVIIASIQTLAAMKFRRLKAILSRWTPEIVIVDEAHHAAAASYRTMLALLGFLPMADATDEENIEAATHDDLAVMEQALEQWDTQAPQDRVLIGMTATPNRSDEIGLGCVFQTMAYNYGLRQAIDDGWLVPPTPWTIETATSLDGVRTTAGEFNQKDLGLTVNNPIRNGLAIKGWLEKAAGRPTLMFSVDVAHAHALADLACENGVKAQAISGETPREDRKLYLRQFAEGSIDLLTNCMVLTEGTDLPTAACIVHAKPTKSATLYEQITGRGLRLHPDDPGGPARVQALARGDVMLKPDCVLIDVVDVCRRHSLQTAPSLYGLPPGLKLAGENLKAIEDALEAMRNQGVDVSALMGDGRLSLAELQIKATRVDLWTVHDLGTFAIGRLMDWTKVGPDDYRLQYPWLDGVEVLRVTRDLLGKFEVSLTFRGHEKGATPRQRTMLSGIVSAEAAATLAEQFVLQERASVRKVTDSSATWRRDPASEKQLAFLRKMRAPIPVNCTKGQAGRLIDGYMARRGRR